MAFQRLDEPIRIDPEGFFNRPLPKPNGLHLWATMGLWRVQPHEQRSIHIDHENLISFYGVQCLHCDVDFDDQDPNEPCPGESDND